MDNLKILNILYAFILIILGLVLFVGQYFVIEKWEWSTLLPSIGGALLLLLNRGIVGKNRLVIQLAVVITLMVGILAGYMLLKGLSTGILLSQSNIIFFLIAFFSFIAMIIYVSRFLDYKSERKLGEAKNKGKKN
jgi:hypothetical protein